MEIFGEVVKIGLIVFGVITCVALIVMAIPGNALVDLVKDVLKRLGATAAGTVYVLSPIDVIPDIVLGVGQLDDIAVLGLMIYYWITLFKRDQGYRPLPPEPNRRHLE